MQVNSFGYALVSFILANRLPGQEGEQLCGLGRYFLCRHCHGLAYSGFQCVVDPRSMLRA